MNNLMFKELNTTKKIEQLFNRENKASQKKPLEIPLEPRRPKVGAIQRNVYDELNKELLLSKRINNIYTNALLENSNNIPFSTDSSITPDMIELYKIKEKENRNVIATSIVPSLENEITPQEFIDAEVDYTDALSEKQYYLQNINNNEQELILIEDEKKRIKEQYDTKMQTIQGIHSKKGKKDKQKK